MKNKIKVIIMVAVCLLGVLYFRYNKRENRLLNIFNENREYLDSVIENYIENGEIDFRETDGISSVNLWKSENTIIEFMTDSTGIAPSGKYYGFYYSVDGSPAAFQNTDTELIYNENGWYEWSSNGNGGKTQNIDGNWWTFEAHF